LGAILSLMGSTSTRTAAKRVWRDRGYAIAFYAVLTVHLSLCAWVLITTILNRDTYLKMRPDLPVHLRTQKAGSAKAKRQAGGAAMELHPPPVDL
jgi:hypothetical protein